MADERKHFTYMWQIKNFSFNLNCKGRLGSPTIKVDSMNGTYWKLKFRTLSTSEGSVLCSLEKVDSGSPPARYELDFELAFFTGHGSLLYSEEFSNQVFRSDFWWPDSKEKSTEIFVLKKHMFAADDTLIIRCRMWKSGVSIPEMGNCVAQTLIEAINIPFGGTISDFSSEPTYSSIVCITSSPSEIPVFSMEFSSEEGDFSIEIQPFDYDVMIMVKYKLFIVDNCGNKLKFGQGDFDHRKSHYISLGHLKDHLLHNRERYLPNDVLNIICEVIFPTGRKKEKMKYGYNKKDIRTLMSDVTNAKTSFVEDQSEVIPTLKDDLTSLLSEGILCDAELKTSTEIFPVHTAVLSARSPVFTTMFMIDMKEKTNKCVDITDLDADTVRKMLLYMYSDTLCDLDYKTAKSLYFAGDKYDITSLRHKCTNFLKQYLQNTNCCDVLLLADKHMDSDLKRAVQNYIADNDEAVLLSEEWKDLEENHSRLTTEVFRFLYAKETGLANLPRPNLGKDLRLAHKLKDKDLKEAVVDYIEVNDRAVLPSEELEQDHSRLTTQVFRCMYMGRKKRS